LTSTGLARKSTAKAQSEKERLAIGVGDEKSWILKEQMSRAISKYVGRAECF
jgi:hypothetical protein